MKKHVHCCHAMLVCACTIFVLCISPGIQAAQGTKPMRIAYIEGGFNIEFSETLFALAQSLKELGIIAQGDMPDMLRQTSSKGIWLNLAANTDQSRMIFVSDAFYSADWDPLRFEEQKDALLQRLRHDKDIDLILAFGTKAGLAIVADVQKTPVVALAATDAVASGITASIEDSGHDNLFALVEDDRYYRELMLFHGIFKFVKLGVAYEATHEGRGTVAYSQIENAARDGQFELVTCTNNFWGTPESAAQNMIACNEQFAKEGVEAVYMTLNNGLMSDHMGDMLAPLIQAGIPTFAQNGSPDVKKGALLSISQENYKGRGMFAARAIANILKGESPRAQKQRHEEPLSLAVNLRTAMRIGWNPPLAVLAAVDTIFER